MMSGKLLLFREGAACTLLKRAVGLGCSFSSRRDIGFHFSLRSPYKPNYQADNYYGAEQSVSKHLLPPVF